jgi:hypothetical protein
MGHAQRGKGASRAWSESSVYTNDQLQREFFYSLVTPPEDTTPQLAEIVSLSFPRHWSLFGNSSDTVGQRTFMFWGQLFNEEFWLYSNKGT